MIINQSEAGPRRPVVALCMLAATTVALLVAGTTATTPGAAARQTSDLEATVNETLGLRQSTLLSLRLDLTPGVPLQAELPLAGARRVLDMRPHSVRAASYAVYRETAQGLIELPAGPVNTLRGVVTGSPDSVVAASVMEEGLYAMIELDGQRFFLEPVARRVPAAAPDVHVLYRDDDVLPTGGHCGVVEAELLANAEVRPPSGEGAMDGGPGICTAELACDADIQYVNRWGTGTEGRINSVINTVNVQYERDVEIAHEISAIILHDDPGNNPYTSTGAGSLLNQFRNHWLSAHNSVPRDAAHLFTGKNLSGSTIGIAAAIGAICSNLAYCLSQSDCCGSFGASTDLTAHELGHLWGGFHCGFDCGSSCDCNFYTMKCFIQASNRFHPSCTIPDIVDHRNQIPCLVCQPPGPPNDDCANALPIAGTTTFDNLSATTDGPNEPGACTENNYTHIDSDVWFAHTSQCDGPMTIETCLVDFDTKIAVYTSCPTGSGQFVACNDNACGNNGSRVTFTAQAGQNYLIRVGGFQGAQGSGVLQITCGSTCPEDINGDNVVDVLDLLALLAAWGPCPGGCPEDINGDESVDVLDLLELLAAWGPC